MRKTFFISLVVHLSLLASYLLKFRTTVSPPQKSTPVIQFTIKKKQNLKHVPQRSKVSLPKTSSPRVALNQFMSPRVKDFFYQKSFQTTYVHPKQEEGITTEALLKANEFVFHSYYQRIREQLSRSWSPVLTEQVLRYYDSGHFILTDRDYTTQVFVILNQFGELKRVELQTGSGLKCLDATALLAFQKAGPFPNPPRGMTNELGEIRFSWDFVLKS